MHEFREQLGRSGGVNGSLYREGAKVIYINRKITEYKAYDRQ
jgi:hypothetical protein